MIDFFNLILNLHKEKNFNQALKEIDNFEKKNFSNSDTLNLKGLTYWFLNENEASLNCFNSAIDKLDINLKKNENIYKSVLINRGLINLKLANYFNAIKDFTEVIKLDPEYAQSYNNIGLAYQKLGDEIKALDYFVIANNKKPSFYSAQTNLINSLTHNQQSFNKSENNIVKVNEELNQKEFSYNKEYKIDELEIFSIINSCNQIIDKTLNKIIYNETQISIKMGESSNCNRHQKIFFEHDIIPKNCFSCFKILIEPNKVIDLIKLHILFGKLEITNERKCMIETRKNIEGNYKGFIYCETLEEAYSIHNKLDALIKININKNVKTSIKRGCSEYVNSYHEYKNLEKLMVYKKDWKIKEEIFDKKNPYFKEDLNNYKTKSRINLKDILIFRNWIYFAYLKNDSSYKQVSSSFYESQFIKNLINR
tara:strand:+ start:343 stop:1614 length:1272 start_codon:yes stop_codon:yes gene_type:complete